MGIDLRIAGAVYLRKVSAPFLQKGTGVSHLLLEAYREYEKPNVSRCFNMVVTGYGISLLIALIFLEKEKAKLSAESKHGREDIEV